MMIDLSPESLLDLERISDYLLENFGEKVSKDSISNIMKDIRSLETFPYTGYSVFERYNIVSDYRCIYTNKNYVFYRLESDYVKIIRVLGEKQDFMHILFGVKTKCDETGT